jgi:transposase
MKTPHRFGKSRDVGCYLGLQRARRNSGQSEPQLHISGNEVCNFEQLLHVRVPILTCIDPDTNVYQSRDSA